MSVTTDEETMHLVAQHDGEVDEKTTETQRKAREMLTEALYWCPRIYYLIFLSLFLFKIFLIIFFYL